MPQPRQKQKSDFLYNDSIIIRSRMEQKPQPPDRIQAYMTHIFRYAKFESHPQISLSHLLQQLTATLATSLLSHQIIYTLTPQPKRISSLTLSSAINLNLLATRRPTEHTLTIFTTKILLDHLNSYSATQLNAYQLGAITGLLGYLFGRPLDQIDSARLQIFRNQKKSISRLDAVKVVLRHDGLKGFYRHENALGLLCPILYRLVYFGLYARLLDLPNNNNLTNFVLLPLAASAGASFTTAIPDKLRSYCLQVNEAKSKALQRRNKNKVQQFPSTSKLLLQYVSGKEFTFNKSDCYHIGFSVIKNWLVLSCFAYGQYLAQLHEQQTGKTQSAH